MFRINTLRTQLNFSILFILLLSFVGSVSISISNSKLFFKQQLASLSINTAQQLSQQLLPLLENDDRQQLKYLIDETFDTTQLSSIVLFGAENKVIYQRKKEALQQTPFWFVRLFSLQFSQHTQVISSEWLTEHVIEVVPDSDYATAQLWENTLLIAYFTLFIFCIALFFGYLLLKQIYSPLRAISLQAKSIQIGDYAVITKLPRAIELKNVVMSMNFMVENIKNTFEELTHVAENTHKEAYIDPQTNIPNRRAFNDKLDTHLSKSSDYQGFIGLVRINELAKLNQLQGYQSGDQLIQQIIIEISDSMNSNEGFYLCRMSGAELCFFIENQSIESIESICELLVSRFRKLASAFHQQIPQQFISLGVIEFNKNDKISSILGVLDELTLNASDIAAGYRVQYLSHQKTHLTQALQNQKSIIESILLTPKSSIQLKSQKVLTLSDRVCFDYEIFSSFFFEQQEINPTEIFSIANKYQMTASLDEVIVRNLLFSIKDFVTKNEILAISLSHLTFVDESSVLKIVALLEQSKMCKHLVVQIHEQSVVDNIKHAKKMLELFQNVGCHICINHFGSSIESLQYLIGIQPDFVKIAPSFTRHIDKKSENLQVVSAFVRMAHGLNIPVIAHCVETNEELITLSELRLDAALGYVIDKPKVNK